MVFAVVRFYPFEEFPCVLFGEGFLFVGPGPAEEVVEEAEREAVLMEGAEVVYYGVESLSPHVPVEDPRAMEGGVGIKVVDDLFRICG